MKKITLLICLTIFTLSGYSQDTQNGYYINASGQKVTGEFMQADFFDADALKFKPSGASFEKLDIDNVIEYGISDDYKFVKRTVQIDNSNLNINQLSQNREPNFVEETLFLNVVVDGDATLYSYKHMGAQKYFYSIQSKGIKAKQLVYKQYMASSAIKSNNEFRQQLYVDSRCPEDKVIGDFLDIEYDVEDLKEIFIDYNSCVNSDYTVYENKSGNKIKINYTVFAGVHSTSFGTSLTPETDSNITYGGGFELGIVLPSQKFGLFLRAEYEKFSVETVNIREREFGEDIITTYKAESHLLNFAFGPRYFFNISGKSKIYIDAGLQMTFPVSNGNLTSNGSIIAPLGNTFSINGGVGYMFNNKFGAELRADTNRDLSGGAIKFDFTRIGLNLRYTIN